VLFGKTSRVQNDSTLKVPRYSLTAGIGGIVVYLFSSTPFIVVVAVVKLIQDIGTQNTSSDDIQELLKNQWVLAGALLTQCLFFFLYLWLVSRIRGTGNPFRDITMRFKKTSVFYIFLGFGLQLLGILLSIPFQLMHKTHSEQEVVTDFRDSGGVGMIVLLILFAFLVPVVEEMCFRGLFMHGLSKKIAPWVSVLTTGIVFAGVHYSDPSAWSAGPILLLVGITVSALAMYRGSIDASIFVHMGFNLTTVIAILLTR
jgi:membrane protease YdiL (CAAX protease family)